MKNQRKKLGWGLLVPVFALVLSLFSALVLPTTPVYAADCSSLYTAGSNEYKVCEEGFTNSSNATYCDKYQGSAAYNSCTSGQQLASGQTPTNPTTGTSPACDRYTSGSNEYKVCNEAFNNASDTTYCNQYSGTSAYDPCYVGQMAKLGQDTTPPSQSNSDLYNRSGVEAWCNSQYGNGTNEAKSCQEGAKNMGTTDYCERYQGTAAYSSCKAGWDYMQKWANDNGATIVNTTPAGTTNTSDTTCVIPYVGWMICPVLLAASKGVDAAYNVVDGILETPVSIFTESGTNGVGEVYGKFLNVANIALAVIFLVIIVGQAVPGALPNYTLKKYLPKLIIGAVAINVAFYACAAIVDVTNIVGKSIPGFFNSMTAQNVTQNIPSDWTVPEIGSSNPGAFGSATSSNDFSSFVAAILGGTAIVGGIALFQAGGLLPLGWALVMFLIPIVLGAIVAILAVLLALVLRSALIIILVIISPLAFAALALPNIEGLFKKWWGLFYKLLLLYPIVALIFGGSKLAGSILMNVATTSAGSVAGAFLALAATATTILPLILVPGVLKGAVSATGKLGQRIEGMADKGYSGAKTLADKRMKESGTGQYFGKKAEVNKGLRTAGVGFGERSQTLRKMPSRRDWRRANSTTIANKIDTDYASGYELLLDSETSGMDFPDQVNFYQREFVKASQAGDFTKANVIMVNKLGKTSSGRKSLKQAMTQHHIGYGNTAFDNQLKGAISVNKGDFMKDAQLYQFASGKSTRIDTTVDVRELGMTDTEIASQSDADMEFLRGVDAARAGRILADTKVDLNQKTRDALARASTNSHNMNLAP